MLTRRETILGLGTLAAGAGAVVGTGAIDAGGSRRNMTVEFADDADAVIGMSPGKGDRSYVNVTEGGDGVISIEITNTNANARTVISDLVTFTNNGEQTVRDITFSVDDRSEGADVTVHGDMEGVGLAPGESVTGLGITIDTIDYAGKPDIKGSITVNTVTAYGGA